MAYLGLISIHMVILSHHVKRDEIVGMKALIVTLRKEVIVEVTCWELKSYLFKALVLPIFTDVALKFGEVTFKTLIERFMRRARRYI